MSNEIQRFAYAPTSEEVGFLVKDGKEYINGMDVAKVLGKRKASDITRNLDKDEYILLNSNDLNRAGAHYAPTTDAVSYLTESGFYHAVMVSRSPKAKPFRRWVTEVVLPSIRNQGYYVMEGQVKKLQDEIESIRKEKEWAWEQMEQMEHAVLRYAPLTDVPDGGHRRRGSNVQPYKTAEEPLTNGKMYTKAIKMAVRTHTIEDWMYSKFKIVIEADIIKGTKHTNDEQALLELIALGKLEIQTTLWI